MASGKSSKPDIITYGDHEMITPDTRHLRKMLRPAVAGEADPIARAARVSLTCSFPDSFVFRISTRPSLSMRSTVLICSSTHGSLGVFRRSAALSLSASGGGCWVEFRVKQVPPTEAKPHGIDYSLCLIGPDGGRLVCYDNAHP